MQLARALVSTLHNAAMSTTIGLIFFLLYRFRYTHTAKELPTMISRERYPSCLRPLAFSPHDWNPIIYFDRTFRSFITISLVNI